LGLTSRTPLESTDIADIEIEHIYRIILNIDNIRLNLSMIAIALWFRALDIFTDVG
jgi:hypothetical protein